MPEPRKVPGYSLRQLLYFVTVAEEGSVSAASAKLSVSPSAVSLALSELERALQSQLCVRRKAHGVTLTVSGTQLLHLARALLRQARELESELTSADGRLSGPLAIGSFQGLASLVLPRLLQGFGQLHPGVVIDFEERDQTELQQRLIAGKLDLVVLYDVSRSPEVDGVELTRLRPYLLLSVEHRLAREPKVALRDIAREPMVLCQEPPSLDYSLGLCRNAGVTPVIRYRVRSGETARALVAHGLGYAIMMRRPPNDRSLDGLPVVYKEIADLPRVDVPVLLGWPRDIRVTRRAEAFVRYSREALNG